MNYPIILESLLKEVSKRDFERPILLKVLPELLKPDIPPDIPLIYDKELFPSLKAFFLSKKPFFLEKPYIFHSLLKELKGVFLPSEYKALKELLHEGELKLTLDEGSDKLNALKFEGIETGYIERVKGLFSIMEKGDKEAAKELLKKLGFIKRNKDNKEYREFENIKGDNFKDYIDEIFKEYYSNLKRFPLEFKKLAINTIEVLNDFKLIPSEQKEKLFNRKEKYQKNFEEIREKVLIGGEILQKVFLSLGLKIKKKEKEATMKNYKGLLEILQGFGFEKMDIKEPNFIYFGSFKSGFALKASDIDTTILTNTAFNERDLLTPLLEYLKEYKIKRNSEMKDKSKLLTYELEDRAKLNIRIPIIKFIDKEKDFKADIAVNNVLGVANSTLLKVYSKIDSRCKDMGLILKNWAKQWDITREESLSSYALILMMVYFLQLKRILPSLQRIAKEKRKKCAEKPFIRIKRTVKENKTEEFLTDLTFETDLKVIKAYMKEKNYPENNQNLLELLTEFFNFYSYSDKGAFRKYHMKVNIKTGRICFLNTLTQYYENSEKHYMFSIEDPFDRRHNPGDRVKKADKISEIKYKIDSTIMSLEEKSYKQERYKEFFNGN